MRIPEEERKVYGKRKTAATDGRERNLCLNGYAASRLSFRVIKKKKSYFRAGDYGKKRVHFFSNKKENGKHLDELYISHIHPGTTHTNKLTCIIQENNRIVYTGKKEN
ncbi:hypothetical protein ACKA06_13340 [Rossellomorea oryzaecorticis]|uniref:Uncharacterized protein n=1 Tax=Rossellomorea oryzaecorticis TaxID=1396505 RepID=A0ABW8VT77_9BACI